MEKAIGIKSLKILAIGNSFSIDGMHYLYDIAKNAGVEEIILGNLAIGGCSLATHLSRFKDRVNDYIYFKNVNGVWEENHSKDVFYGLHDEKWDYISLQQSSGYSGIAKTYKESLEELIEKVQENKSNLDAKLVWHMTWAYQANSTHPAFESYDNDQSKMYKMIVEAVKENVVSNSLFEVIIPAGTAIQNARKGPIGDTLTVDGFHLSQPLGRYIAGLTWYGAITKGLIDKVTFNPTSLDVKDYVKRALAKVI